MMKNNISFEQLSTGTTSKRHNIQKILKQHQINPLFQLIKKLGLDGPGFHRDSIQQLLDMYFYYYLCMERLLPKVSTAIQYQQGPYWCRRSRLKMTQRQRKILSNYKKDMKWIEIDQNNFLLYARMLVDKTLFLTRHFINEKERPSFTSFNNHRKYFQKRTTKFGVNEEYAEYIRQKTDWFDVLKFARDRFVHNSKPYMKFNGYNRSTNQFLQVMYIVPSKDIDKINRPEPQLVQIDYFNLIHQIYDYMKWLASYGLKRRNNM